jgi:plastocyanin
MRSNVVRTCALALVLAAATGGRGAAVTPPGPAAVVTAAPQTVRVDVGEWFYAPATVDLRRGGTVIFDFVGDDTHTATDSSGLDLYDSGNVEPGGSSDGFTFVAAGIYPFVCAPHPFMGGRVSVPMRVTPSSGGVRRTFTIVWAAEDATHPRVYDVQIRRPGTTWRPWRTGVTGRIDTFTPRAGKGVYRFRARMRDPGLGEASRWSRPSRIRVR